MPNPLLALLGRALEGVLNRTLALDPETRERLRPLDGRTLAVEFRGTPLALRLRVDGNALRVGPTFEGDSLLRVAATPGALLALALRRGEDSAIPPGRVDISGDAELARRVERLASSFQPDIEEAFASVFGDVAGVRIAQAFRGALRYARDRGSALVRDTADYLREEGRDLVAPGEMHEFLDEVDVLRERADRLAARVTRLAERRP